jgi:hypothetical protein
MAKRSKKPSRAKPVPPRDEVAKQAPGRSTAKRAAAPKKASDAKKAVPSAIPSDEEILAKATDHYLTSGDFNGLPVRQLFSDEAGREAVRKALARLMEAGTLTMEFGTGHPNPHIKAFPPHPDVTRHLTSLAESDLAHACAYPSPSVLAKRIKKSQSQDRPFTRRLMLGEAQLEFHAFDLSVLEFYRNDPRYHYETNDIGGWISVRDAYSDPATEPETPKMHERDQVFLQTFGFAYDDDMNRAVVVFTRYLADLSPEHQQIWNAKRLDGTYRLHPDYYRNSIVGDWGTKISIFEAFTAELKHINAMARLMGKPPLFRNEFGTRPKGFSFLVRPTTKELNDFVLTLDQMMSDNLNKDFFRGDIELETDTPRADGKIVVTQKGTIQLLEQWFQTMMRWPDPKPFDEMVSAFRKVRKLRQSPAHKIEDSAFDQGLFKEQRSLVIEAYKAVRTIRLLFANHPAVRDYKVPDELFKGEIWNY